MKIVHDKDRERARQKWLCILEVMNDERFFSMFDSYELKKLNSMLDVFATSLANLNTAMAMRNIESVSSQLDDIEAELTGEQREWLEFLKRGRRNEQT